MNHGTLTYSASQYNGTLARAVHTMHHTCWCRSGLLKAALLGSEGAEPVAMRRNSRLFTLLFTIAVWLHTVNLHVHMLWLTFVLRKPAVIRRIIATELLRRMDQLNTQRRRSSLTPARRRCYTQSPLKNSQFKAPQTHSNSHLTSPRTAQTNLRLHVQAACDPSLTSGASTTHEIRNLCGLKPSVRNIPSEPSRYPGPETSLAHSSIAQHILANALTQDQQHLDEPQLYSTCSRDEPTTTSAQFTPPASPAGRARPPASHRLHARDSVQQSERRHMVQGRGRQSTIRVNLTPPWSEAGSSRRDASPIGLAHQAYSPLKGLDVNYHDDTTEGSSEDTNQHMPSRGLEDAFIDVRETPLRRHRRKNSIESATPITMRRATPVTLRARDKANGGLLELKANSARPRESTPSRMPSRTHRRNVSLKVPIRVTSSQSSGDQHHPSASTASTPHARPDPSATAPQTEAELHYKQRHIFVGTASLFSFLSVLETSPFGYTTRAAVLRAFTLLAAKEQQLARQRSQSPANWHLVSRITADNITDWDYLVLARVQLGSVSLQQFVDSIPFGEGEEASLVVVVDAFKNASHVDVEGERGEGRQAGALRGWLLECGGERE